MTTTPSPSSLFPVARYSFDTFIEGKDNQFAKAACSSVADSPGNTPFNPLLIYSETGLGKTHLLHAIGNTLFKKQPNYQITYLTSERFMLEFINSIQKNKSTDFANQYRASDILLIELAISKAAPAGFVFLFVCIFIPLFNYF